MTARVTVDPYPRLDSSQPDQVRWSALRWVVDGEEVEADRIRDRWDRNSTLSLKIGVSVGREALGRIGSETAEMAVTLACRSTGWCESRRSSLVDGFSKSGPLRTVVDIDAPGRDLAEEITVDAVLTAPFHAGGSVGDWLSRRIIAAMTTARISLSDQEPGFPTSAVSFAAKGWPPVPWSLRFRSFEPQDAFSTSARIYLNQDLRAVSRMIDGGGDSQSQAALKMTIMRGILQHVGACADDHPLDCIAEEHPESLAAAAYRTATQHLRYASLAEAMSDLRNRPHILEMKLMNAAEYLR